MNLNFFSKEITAALDYLDAWVEYLRFCAGAPIPSCAPIWTQVMLLCIAGGIFLVAMGVLDFYRFRRKWDEALKAQALREMVNHTEIEKVRWRGDEVLEPEQPVDLKNIRIEVDGVRRSNLYDAPMRTRFKTNPEGAQ